jgi:hypothetical protein
LICFVGNLAALTHIAMLLLQQRIASAEALAVIFHSAFSHFVKAVAYLLFIALYALNSFLFICLPIVITLYAALAVSAFRLALLCILFKYSLSVVVCSAVSSC